MRYPKEFDHLTSIRLSQSLREEAEKHARFQGLTFSEFVRQSLNRNIHVARDIEEEVIKRTSLITRGLKHEQR